MKNLSEASLPKSIVIPLSENARPMADRFRSDHITFGGQEEPSFLTIKKLDLNPNQSNRFYESSPSTSTSSVPNSSKLSSGESFLPSVLSRKIKIKRRILISVRLLSLLPILYFFVCSLDLLTSGFQLLAGRTAGDLFSHDSLLRNPIAGLMIGVLVTVLVQSSSTTTSIVVSMVSAGIIPVKYSIPMIMGANVGTSTTNTFVALGQMDIPREFELAFSGATIHDVFNWLNVMIQLPLEASTGFLYKLTSKMVENINVTSRTNEPQFLNKFTKPLTKSIIQINKTVVENVAQNISMPANTTMRKLWCGENTNFNSTTNETVVVLIPCKYMLRNIGWPDWGIGLLLTIIALTILITCLMLMVKTLRFLLEGHISKVLRRTIDKDFPGIFRYLTPYAFLLVGIICTVLVQSSSVFTSALTPLVGAGVVSLERMYPLTVGSNVGTTVTAIISAMAAQSVPKLKNSLQAALAHLFFNVIGIVILFGIIPMRRIPISVARFFGRETAKYRWFAILYLVVAFLVIPGVLLGLSVAGPVYAALAFGLMLISVLSVLFLNFMMKRHSKRLPKWLRSWNWLPEPLRSLAPYDRLFERIKLSGQAWISRHVIRPNISVTSMTQFFKHKDSN